MISYASPRAIARRKLEAQGWRGRALRWQWKRVIWFVAALPRKWWPLGKGGKVPTFKAAARAASRRHKRRKH